MYCDGSTERRFLQNINCKTGVHYHKPGASSNVRQGSSGPRLLCSENFEGGVGMEVKPKDQDKIVQIATLILQAVRLMVDVIHYLQGR